MTSVESKERDAPVASERVLPGRDRARPAKTPRRGNPTSGLWAKAQVAARSARALIEKGDTDGAVNRAYYATFGAARAALATVRSSLAHSKGHGTIVRRFDKHLVQERGFDPSLGQAFFARQRHARWSADYDEAQVDESTARAIIGEAERFLAAVEPLLKKAKA